MSWRPRRRRALRCCDHGTAFGSEHVKIVRRLLEMPRILRGCSRRARGSEVIFTFDGDAAGQKAALRAFQDQNFASQTSPSTARGHGPTGCEWRAARQEVVNLSILRFSSSSFVP